MAVDAVPGRCGKPRWRARYSGVYLGTFDSYWEALKAVRSRERVPYVHPTKRLAIELIGKDAYEKLRRNGLMVVRKTT